MYTCKMPHCWNSHVTAHIVMQMISMSYYEIEKKNMGFLTELKYHGAFELRHDKKQQCDCVS